MKAYLQGINNEIYRHDEPFGYLYNKEYIFKGNNIELKIKDNVISEIIEELGQEVDIEVKITYTPKTKTAKIK